MHISIDQVELVELERVESVLHSLQDNNKVLFKEFKELPKLSSNSPNKFAMKTISIINKNEFYS